jgi:hypothetical protein
VLGANTVPANIYAFGPAGRWNGATVQPRFVRARTDVHTYVKSFRTVYPLNAGGNAPI